MYYRVFGGQCQRGVYGLRLNGPPFLVIYLTVCYRYGDGIVVIGTCKGGSMLNFNSVLLSSARPKKLIEFYAKVLKKKSASWGDDDWGGFEVGNGWLTIGPHDKVKGKAKEPERLLLNFETTDVEGEFERIKKAGAKVIAEPYHPGEVEKMSIATFADPDGNYFQLMSPME